MLKKIIMNKDKIIELLNKIDEPLPIKILLHWILVKSISLNGKNLTLKLRISDTSEEFVKKLLKNIK